jgi:hypothetical protein
MSYGGNPTVARFKTDMKLLVNQMKGDLASRYDRQAEELMSNMRGAVPIESGTLKASIRKYNWRQGGSGPGRMYSVGVLIRAGGPMTTVKHMSSGQVYDYALGVEFGTKNRPPEPFFYSSARRYQQIGRAGVDETVASTIAANNKVRELRSQQYNNGTIRVSRGGRGGAIVL